MKITNSGYKLLLLLPLLIFLTSVDKCSGAIGLVGGGGDVIISDLLKVAGTRATARLTVPDDISSDLIGQPGTVYCMDATLSSTFDLTLAFECGSITLNPGVVETILHGLWPDWDYLAAVYESEAVSASVVKATSSSEPVSNIAGINTDLREVSSVAYGNTYNINCRSGYLNSDEIPDFVCGGSGQPGGQLGIWFGSGIPEDNFSVATISGDGVDDEQLGLGLLVADINGDGQDDLIIGDPKFKDQTEDVGSAFIWFGPLQFSNGDDVAVADADQIIPGKFATDRRFGQAITFFSNATMSMSALLVGVPGGFGSVTPCLTEDGSCGFVRGYQWSEALGLMVEFPYGNPMFASYSDEDYALGSQLATGDYDRDGLDDLLLNFDNNGNGPGCHVAKIMLGSSISAGGASFETLHEGTLCLTGMAMFMLQLPQDLNGDGYDDFPVLETVWSAPQQWRTTVYFGGPTVDPTRKLVFEGTGLDWAFMGSADINSSGISKFLEFNLSNTSVFTPGGADSITIGDPIMSFKLPDGAIGDVVDLNGDTYGDFVKGSSANINGDAKIVISY